ncbi:hypothetical protein RSOLAG22IIIB_06185 [Rhizoctonia solani]|uniref:Uncharacterized protein n=1 Tax=Rhizoctonia solani TaxID=456999 RepID=A0A0K6GD16_9AGAM|nr:hypothetical protein RSOLAG22IIIB_06185 [Rhizoctonia solani]
MAGNCGINPNDFVMKLNNLLQARGQLNTLTWRESFTGPAHGPEWTISACTTKSTDTAPIRRNRELGIRRREWLWISWL